MSILSIETKNIKYAIFLGAGASKADGAPLQNELFKKFFEALDSDDYKISGNDNFKDIKAKVCTFMKEYFNIEMPDRGIKFPTFEEALGILDIEQILSDDNYNNNSQRGEYKKALIASMGFAIQYCLDYKNSKQTHYHNDLIKNLREKKLLDSTVFITSNYDLLIDNALNSNINYHINKTGESNSSKINLLKLHGSLNWILCNNCSNIKYIPSRKIAINNYLGNMGATCDVCKKNDFDSIIIPPTYFKQYSEQLKYIWEIAYQHLLKVEHLIFCGYSFPDADIYIKFLFKRAEMDRKEKLRITVLNKNCNADEELRYRRFFMNNVDYEAIDFECFATAPEKVMLDNSM